MKRRLLRTFLILPALLIIIFGAALAYAQTKLAKDQISGIVADNLSGPGRKADISGLTGVLPFDIRVGKIRLSDDQGAWLEVDSARIKTSPTDLLAGRVVIKELGIERVALNRLPSAPADQPEPSERELPGGMALPTLPILPESVPVFMAERIYIDRIELGDAVIGQAAVFNLEAKAGTNDAATAIDAALDLARIDQTSAHLMLRAGADLQTRRLRIDLQGKEDGGLMAALSGRDDAGAMALSLKGEGPLDDFNATLDLKAVNLVSAQAKIGIGIGEIPKLLLKGDAQTADGLLPAELTRLIGQDFVIDINAQEQEPGIFDVQDLSLRAGKIVFDGGGLADINRNMIDISAGLRLNDLSDASALAGLPLGGGALFEARIQGALDRPTVLLDVAAADLVAGKIGAGRIDLNVRAQPVGSLNDGFNGLTARIGAQISGMSRSGEGIFESQPIDLNIEVKAPFEGMIALEQIALHAGPLQAKAQARIDATTLQGKANAEISVADIQALLGSLGSLAPPSLDLTGAAGLTLDTAIGEGGREIVSNLTFSSQHLAGSLAGLGDLTGSSPNLSAQIAFEADGLVKLSDLTVNTKALTLSGDVSLSQESQDLVGQMAFDIPRLAALNALAGQELEGAAILNLALGGTSTDPTATAAVTITDLQAAGRRFDEVSLNADVAGTIETLTADLALSSVNGEESLDLSTSIARDGSVIDLGDLRIEGSTTSFSGDIRLDMDTWLADGALKGAIGDITRLEPWIGQLIEGSLELDSTFVSATDGQNLVAKISTDQIAGAFGALQSAQLDLAADDILGAIEIDARAAVQGFAQPGMRIDDAVVDIAGALDDLTLKADVTGDQNGSFTAVLQARAAFAGPVSKLGPQSLRSLYLDQLDAELQGQTFELQQPAAITLDNGVLDLDQLDLKIGKGSIKGKASLDNGRVLADLALDGFDLAVAESFGGPTLSGALSGTVEVIGSTQSPLVESKIRIDQLALTDAATAFRPAGIDADLRIGPDLATARIVIHDLGEQPLILGANLPLDLSFEPFLFAPRNDDLTVRLNGRADLQRVAEFLVVDGQRLEGELIAALDISGSTLAPKVTGSIGIVDGAIEEINSGARLQDIQILIDGKGNAIQVAEFKARDDNGGELSAMGDIRLAPAAYYPFDVKLETRNLHLLRNDLGDAWFDIDLKATGNRQSASLVGSIDAREIDLDIPSRVAANIDAIEVREINKPGAANVDQTAGTLPIDLLLDVALNAPARLFVRGRGLDSEWGGALRLQGTAAKPQLSGAIEFVRGHLDLLDRRFSIEQGIIAFEGTVPPDPRLLFEARTEGETLDAIVTITGQASAPEVALASDPDGPQDEVLAQLLFGLSVDRITPTQGIRLAAAANRLRGGNGGLDPLGALRDVVGLDTLDIGGESVDQASARAGKYLTDQVYFEIERGVTPNSGRARVELELTDTLTANTEFTEDSQTGVGLDWSIDY